MKYILQKRVIAHSPLQHILVGWLLCRSAKQGCLQISFFFLRAGAAQGFMRSLQELLISEKSWVTCLASGLRTSFKHLFEYVTQGLALLSTSSRLVKQWIGMLVRLLKINKMCLKAWEPASLAFLNGGWSKLCLCSSSAAISLCVIPTFASIQCSPTKQAFLFAFKKFFFFYIA